MLADPLLNYFFEKIDMTKQKQRQKQFVTMVTGGPVAYEGTDMKSAHAKFKIGQKEFDQTWDNLAKALAFYKAPEKEVNEFKEVVYSTRDDIVNS